MKTKQFCSVCKQWLDMEVAPTGDDDDGVIWFRCPQCQGYLPKLGGDFPPAAPSAAADDGAPDEAPASAAPDVSAADDLPWDSPADMMAAREAEASGQTPAGVGDVDTAAGEDDAETDAPAEDAEEPAPAAAEPVAEYAAMLAALDPTTAVPYRPWESYEVGQCIHHLAWDDCGVVVAKENLPGGRKAVKCYFATAGVVRLIEGASR